ncbi:hypothetical protein LQ327_04545 [Actinomycetospora endophytica]|uniref:SCO6045-like C-terminal domain-containing protein n=1 Tax=Actinomycetospora endophytica TaxID=2291215 RepID=A0ABS8P3P8_9PSEU|nr:hypothetical protein [Actinomycetospora endophytica]MCD2192658.1 hypothetical protein [Actinomycetospora endophytica]
MSTVDARADLAARQAALLAALVGAGPVPDGFDAGQVRAEAGALRAKRVRVLVRIVAAMLDDAREPVPADLSARLRDWVIEHPRRTGTGFHDDARAFLATRRRRRRWRRSA